MHASGLKNTPTLPLPLTIPLRLFSHRQHSKIMSVFLNKVLAEQLSDGDLNFLDKRNLCITVSDTNTHYHIGLLNNKLIATSPDSVSDLTIKAKLYDLLTLIARQQDPDTLIFQRKMIMEGNTELGLEVKNFLDGIDLNSNKIYPVIETLLAKALPLYKKIFSNSNRT